MASTPVVQNRIILIDSSRAALWRPVLQRRQALSVFYQTCFSHPGLLDLFDDDLHLLPDRIGFYIPVNVIPQRFTPGIRNNMAIPGLIVRYYNTVAPESAEPILLFLTLPDPHRSYSPKADARDEVSVRRVPAERTKVRIYYLTLFLALIPAAILADKVYFLDGSTQEGIYQKHDGDTLYLLVGNAERKIPRNSIRRIEFALTDGEKESMERLQNSREFREGQLQAVLKMTRMKRAAETRRQLMKRLAVSPSDDDHAKPEEKKISNITDGLNDGEKTPSDPLHFHILEISDSFSLGGSAGEQSAYSILESMRVIKGFVLSPESFEGQAESIKQYEKRKVGYSPSPVLRYNVPLFGKLYAGFRWSADFHVHEEKEIHTVTNRHYRDEFFRRADRYLVRLGYGPLDYLTSDWCGEFSLGREISYVRGPYKTPIYKLPHFDVSNGVLNSTVEYTIGEGQLSYRTKANLLGGGIVVNLFEYFSLYFHGDLAFLSGDLELLSAYYSLVQIDESATGTLSGEGADRLLQMKIDNGYSYGFMHVQVELTGIEIKLEIGSVIKLNPNWGIRIGGFFQFTDIELDNPSAVEFESGLLLLEEYSAVRAADSEYTNRGIILGIVSRF